MEATISEMPCSLHTLGPKQTHNGHSLPAGPGKQQEQQPPHLTSVTQDRNPKIPGSTGLERGTRDGRILTCHFKIFWWSWGCYFYFLSPRVHITFTHRLTKTQICESAFLFQIFGCLVKVGIYKNSIYFSLGNFGTLNVKQHGAAKKDWDNYSQRSNLLLHV